MTPEARLALLGGAGPALVLIHGFGADRFGWAANAHALFAKARVWAAELPGHGEAPAEVGDGSADTLAAAVARALAEVPRPFAVAAHSLGGAVALRLARRMPGAIGSLTLLSPAGLGGPIDADFLDAYPKLQTEAEALSLLQSLVQRPRLIAPAMAAHVLKTLARPGRREALATVAAALKSLAPAPLPDLPTRLIWGAEDRINPPGPAAAWGERLTLLPDTGHLPQVEAAGRVNRLLLEALA